MVTLDKPSQKHSTTVKINATSLSMLGDEKIRLDGLHHFLAVGCEEPNGLATCSLATPDTSRRIFEYDTLKNKVGIKTSMINMHILTVLRLHATFLRAEKVWIGARYGQSMNAGMKKTYAGFPFSTSSATTKTSGIVTPAMPRAAVAYFLVAEVQMAQLGLGSL